MDNTDLSIPLVLVQKIITVCWNAKKRIDVLSPYFDEDIQNDNALQKELENLVIDMQELNELSSVVTISNVVAFVEILEQHKEGID